jgi:hypothetical protein
MNRPEAPGSHSGQAFGFRVLRCGITLGPSARHMSIVDEMYVEFSFDDRDRGP